ncbi:LexA family transcriptional regulator [Aliarcobacter butzleri]|uniref:LexA family transcriptional regulator n=1 Tax=Aliarcobacter butzleri TaxID=28197 RepID=UPI002875E3C8|nr:XRE family transcriptional regulator [Aliarcobacter butzleri]MDS1315793.1 XRE family transcriptional regulator [Aliarcobacter butzleri]
MGIGTNIKNILEEKKIKQKDFAMLIKETTVNVNRYLNEQRNIPVELYPTISEVLNMSIDEIIGNKILTSKYIPLIGKSSCGKPKDYDLNGYEPVPVPLDMYKEGMYAVEADGDSMSPKINDGDIVYCQPNRIIDSGNIVHYWLNGESGIKKYKMNEQGTIISLIPINSDYDIITIHCDDKHELIMARVVGKIDRDF